MITTILLFVLGMLYTNAIELLFHKYALHGLGKNRSSFFSFHWRSHHQKARKNEFRDEDYEEDFFKSSPQYKEFGLLLIGLAAHLPLLWIVSPAFFLGAATLGLLYFPMHKYSHLNPEWCRKWMPWHYDHHMGVDQDANWCVTFPFFDYIMGTRIKYDYEDGKARYAEHQTK